MRDIAAAQGHDPARIDSKCPADLVVDHSVQVDFSHIEKHVQQQQKHLQTQSFPVPTFPPFYNGEVYYYEYNQTQGASALPPPDLRVPMDNPGLPVQDEVCPFHLRLSYWAETLQKNRHSDMEKNNERQVT